jgi:DNA (cytosine-5)-methyltransferase 1
MTCEELLATYADRLEKLQGQVDLVVGGPPCQGFSIAGRRNPADPRNQMTEQYLSLVSLLAPRFLVIENVAGFNFPFENASGALHPRPEESKESYAHYVAQRLSLMGYDVSPGLVNCAWFGVPQARWRYIMLCERRDGGEGMSLRKALVNYREAFLAEKGLPTDRPVSAQEAISDMEISGRKLLPCLDSHVPGFLEAEYHPPESPTVFQALMRHGINGLVPNSRRLARHREDTINYFRRVQAMCRPGHCLSKDERRLLGTRKHSLTVLHPDCPAPTVTTLPDDILHYSEPRILTVRENARLQSFPDWFEFLGNYTTGGKGRKHDCPRYTQVGNAVPPLLAEAIGAVLRERSRAAAHQAAASSALAC